MSPKLVNVASPPLPSSQTDRCRTDRLPLPRHRASHRRQRLVILEIWKRRDLPPDKFVFRDRNPPLVDLVLNPVIEVRRKALRVLPVLGEVNSVHPSMS